MNTTIIQPLWIFALAIIFIASTAHFGYNFLLSEELYLKTGDDEINDDDSWIKQTLSMPTEPTASNNRDNGQNERMFNYDYSIYINLQDYCDQTLATSRPKFNKFVLFIIDALRVDFVKSIIGEEQRKQSPHQQSIDPLLPYTEKVMQTNGIGMISVATIPTVTLPRIKALITGTLPSFMDYFLNLIPMVSNNNVDVEKKTKKQFDDNIVEQFNRQGKSIVFYGDDTWKEIFPSSNKIFKRINVTSSLFATDYTEVDSNVTYNLNRELKSLNDWDVMILHYLGVDHIGHLRGFHSELFSDKFYEMDNVFRNIFDTITYSGSSNDSYLIVITGDHGMTDAGNHGGHTNDETNTALIFISTNKIHYIPQQSKTAFKNDIDNKIVIFQLDFAATITVLFGLKLPRKNQGRIISSVLERFNIPNDEHLCHLFRNALQTQKLLLFKDHKETKSRSLLRKQFITALKYHWNFINEQNRTKTKNIDNDDDDKSEQKIYEDAKKSYQQFIGQIQHEFVYQTIDRSFWSSLIGAIMITVIIVFILLYIEIVYNYSSSIIIVHLLKPSSSSSSSSSLRLLSLLILLIFSIRFCSLGSINFILNEHLFWYYSTLLLLLINLFIVVKNNIHLNNNQQSNYCHYNRNFNDLVIIKFLCLITIFIILMYWRMPILTDQDLNRNDISNYLQLSSNKHLLSSLVIFALIITAAMIYNQTSSSKSSYYFLITSFILIYLYRSYMNQVTIFRLSCLTFLAKYPNFCPQIIYLFILFIIFDCINRKFQLYKFLSILSWIVSNSENNSIVKGICLNTFTTIWIIMSLLLMEPSLIPVLTMNILMEKILCLILSQPERSFDHKYNQIFYRFGLYICMAYSSFYQLGNRNSLSTISVKSCFIGLNQHRPFICGLFMIISMYSTMIYWMIMFFIRFRDDFLNNISNKYIPKNYQTFLSIITITFIKHFAIMSMTMFVTWWLRDHLFIWSIICPKLIYELCFTVLITIFLFIIFFLYTHDDCFNEIETEQTSSSSSLETI
ncbi:uncharacterized protein LOC113789903 [Dermatophagoides pteronyssinus]|uniref:uncharacterized protein LOC113789903 n=1 Tax=Dermatophagoides pteronyssinus TaxID=6956 RepID=UPI003F661A59